MTKTLDQKVDEYNQKVLNYKKESRRYFLELDYLICECEDKYDSLIYAPDDSEEIKKIKEKQKQKPELIFKKGKHISKFGKQTKEVLKRQVLILYKKYTPTIIGYILGLDPKSVNSVVYRTGKL